jgi:Pyruvate/2-oxoacid:ferredoxin oxidoreductase gamma subunit
MHPMGWSSMLAKLRPGGIVLINTSVFEQPVTYDGTIVPLAVTGMAAAAGMQQAGAMLALGAFAAATGVVKIETLQAIAEEVLPPYRRQFAAANRRALSTGYEAVAKPLCPAWPGSEHAA